MPAATFPVIPLPVSELKIDPRRFQCKGDADDCGVVPEERLSGDYRELGTGAIIVWEDRKGAYWVADGHHRYDLALRTRKADIPAQVIREAEGYSETDAIALAAEANILNGTGTIPDYARYFRNFPISREDAEGRGLLAREKGRLGWEIGLGASDDLYSWYIGHPGLKEARVAAAISSAAPGDPGLQAAGLRFYLENGADALEVGLFIRGLKAFPGGQEGLSQPDLFGMEDFLATERALASEAARIIREVRRCEGILHLAITRKGRLELTGEEAGRWGITDKGNEFQIRTAHARVQQDLREWENYRLHPDKLRELYELIGERPKAIPLIQSDTRRRPQFTARQAFPPKKINIPDKEENIFRAVVFHTSQA